MLFATAVCILIGNKVVTVSRKENQNLFSIPGGKIECGEQPIQCAMREVYEETGIVLGLFDLKSMYNIEKDEDGNSTAFYFAKLDGSHSFEEFTNSENCTVKLMHIDELISCSRYDYNHLKRFLES